MKTETVKMVFKIYKQWTMMMLSRKHVILLLIFALAVTCLASSADDQSSTNKKFGRKLRRVVQSSIETNEDSLVR